MKLPSKRIEEIRENLMRQTIEKTEYHKLRRVEQLVVQIQVQHQSIIAFLDEAISHENQNNS